MTAGKRDFKTRCFYWLLPAVLALMAASSAQGEIKLDFWHSYTHQPSGIVHYSFQIASYKRGLFFGSCGPSTRSLQWEYDIDLAGPGPKYQVEQISMSSDLKKVFIVSGTITVNARTNEASIRLRIRSGNSEVDFPGNGTQRIQKAR